MKNVFDRIVSQSSNSSGVPAADAQDSSQREQALQESVDVEYSDADSSSADYAEAGGLTSIEVKGVVQELLKAGYLEESHRPDMFRRAIVHAVPINLVLEPLDLILRVDSHRGVAYLTVAQAVLDGGSSEDGWSHPLVRRQRLTLEQSLLVALLRQVFVLHEQESGVGQSAAKIAVDELLPQFLTYFEDSGSDAKNESRLLNLLDQLKTYGIVSEVDPQQAVTIRPLIAHLANPESLAALLQLLKEQRSAGQDAQNGSAGDAQSC